MTIQMPNRILELWPQLSPDKQAAVLDLIETIAIRSPPLELDASEHAALEQSKADFEAGRVYNEQEYEAQMARFMNGLMAKSPAAR